MKNTVIVANGYAVLFAEVKLVIELNYPLYCPKCKQESLIDAKDLQITVIKELEAKM